LALLWGYAGRRAFLESSSRIAVRGGVFQTHRVNYAAPCRPLE
jgi:hypothetical protein